MSLVHGAHTALQGSSKQGPVASRPSAGSSPALVFVTPRGHHQRGLLEWDFENVAPSEQLGPVGGQGARVGAGPAAPAPQPRAGPARGALKEVGTGAAEAAPLRRWEEEGVLSTPQVVPRACATGLLLFLLLGKLPHASPGAKGLQSRAAWQSWGSAPQVQAARREAPR